MYIRTYDLQSKNMELPVFDFIFSRLISQKTLTLQDILLFDIETTGFSAKSTFCYLIGCVYYQDNAFRLIQWFADSQNDEELVLDSFFTFLKQYKAVLHYNGNGFDIPYLMQKAGQYNMEAPFAAQESIDLYKLTAPYKNFFKLDNMKQKTVEGFLSISREDAYTGGQLISVYHDYLKTPSDDAKRLLLLHNKEDLVGLFYLLPILSYHCLFNGLFTIQACQVMPYTNMQGEQGFEFHIELKLQAALPRRISCGYGDFYFTGFENTARLKIKICSGELKFFYQNYKDYYYLPLEDGAIHKSVASFVDKDHKSKAKPANCYLKKEGHFLPQYESIICPCFQLEYQDKITFFELTDTFLNDGRLMKRYVLHILNLLTTAKKE